MLHGVWGLIHGVCVSRCGRRVDRGAQVSKEVRKALEQLRGHVWRVRPQQCHLIEGYRVELVKCIQELACKV